MSKQNPFFGIFLMITAMAFFSTKDGFAKFLVDDLSPVQIIWAQFAFTFVLMALITAPKHGLRAFLPTPIGPQILRGLAAVGGVGTFYWALIYIPLADASAMILIAPLVVTALSPFLLDEKIGRRRVIAVAIGFIGVLLILRPGFRGDIAGYAIAMLTGLLYGLNYIGSRKLGNLHPPLINLAHSVLIGTIVLAPFMPFVWKIPPATQNFNVIAFLIISIFGQGLMINAFRYGQAAVIAPYQYTVIVFATAIGYLGWGTFPDAFTWIGIAFIVAAGIFIAVREGQIAKSDA